MSLNPYTNIDTPMHWSPAPQEEGAYRKALHSGEDGMVLELVYYPAGTAAPAHTHSNSHGLYVLEGVLQTDRGSFEKGQFVWFPAGVSASHGAGFECDARVLSITNSAQSDAATAVYAAGEGEAGTIRTVNAERMPWKAEGRCSVRLLLGPGDFEAGIMVKELLYAKGCFTPWPFWSCRQCGGLQSGFPG